jgi:hypothetical protein
MQHDLILETAPLESRVRFSLRGMLIATAAAAACFASVTPWFQAWNAEQKKAFLIFWGEFALVVTATVAIRCALRVRTERRAGPVRYRLRPSITKIAILLSICSAIFRLGLAVCLSLMSAMVADVRSSALRYLPHILVVHVGMSLGGAAVRIWWETTCLELCDGGILGNAAFAPWRTLSGVRWGTSNPNLLVLQYPRSIGTVLVNPCDKAALEQFLGNRLDENAGPANLKPMDGKG